MKINLKRRQSGFTIIEVVIVLAIAATIMVVVFLAVPSLQRNSRNNQYKTEATSLVAAIQEYAGNNNGTMPVAANSAAVIALTKNQKITALTIQAPASTTVGNINTAYFMPGATCGAVDQSATNAVTAATGTNVLVYGIEKSGGAIAAQCLQF